MANHPAVGLGVDKIGEKRQIFTVSVYICSEYPKELPTTEYATFCCVSKQTS